MSRFGFALLLLVTGLSVAGCGGYSSEAIPPASTSADDEAATEAELQAIEDAERAHMKESRGR